MVSAQGAVIDTNVLAVAERMHTGASDQCIAACIDLLRRVEAGLILVVDTEDRILGEYVGTLEGSGTAGLAVKLAQRLWRTRRDPRICKAVGITPIDDPPGSYEEVPVGVRDFDRDDQKFLAVAVSEGSKPPVFQALDREWWHRRADLNDAGLDVQFLCASDLFGDSE